MSNKATNIEIRTTTSSLKVEEGAVIEGTAAVFNSPTNIGGLFYEEILTGAFDEVLNDDVRCLLNHNPNYILGRSKSGTLKLWVDENGLHYRYNTPDRTFAKDLSDAIDCGDVSQSSFSFIALEEVWVKGKNGDLDTRQIKKVGKLFDVSPVTYPAYEDTTVAKRSFDLRKKTNDTTTNLSTQKAQLLINKNLS